jgi:predicted dehydrogenase
MKIMDNQNRIKLAVLGGSINSAVGSAHIFALNLTNKFEVVSGCFSRDPEINTKTASEYGIQEDRVFPSLEKLINSEKNKIDAILILTPTNQHKDQILFCSKHNIPIICEKALATSYSEALEIENTIKENNTFLVVIYNYLGYPMLRELKNLIKNNRFGKIKHIQIEMPQEGFKRLNSKSEPVIPQDWRLKDNNIPTISLDLGVHLHMMVRYLTNEKVIKVIANQESFGNFPSVIDNVNSMIKYTNSMTCSMWYSKAALGKRNGMKINIYGENLSAEWVQEFPEYLILADQFGHITKLDRASNDVVVCNLPRYSRFKAGHPAGFIEAFANYYIDVSKALEDFLLNKKDVLNDECFGIQDSKEGLSLLEAMSKSHLTNEWQNINI